MARVRSAATPNPATRTSFPPVGARKGEAIRIYNSVRLVRDGDVTETLQGDPNADSTIPSAELGDSSSTTQTADQAAPVDQPIGPGEQQHPDLAIAATELGVNEEALQNALGDPSQGPPDFAAAAAALGVTEEALIAALGVAGGNMRPVVGPPPMNAP